MHLLFATSIVPDGSLGSGYEIANEAIVDALRRNGARVTSIGFAWPGRTAALPRDTIVLGELDVRTDSATSLQKVKWLAEAIRSGLTFSSAKLRAAGEDRVREAIRKAGPFDAYVLNSVQFAGAFPDCVRDRPTLFIAHNVEARSASENARTAQDAFQRVLYRREAQLVHRLETRLCQRARFVYTLSEDDRLALGVPAGRSTVLPLVTRKAAPAPEARRAIDCDAALVGTWTWQPNRVGLEWFLNEVVPLLPDGFRVEIAGSLPSDIRSDHPGVAFVGRVPDAQAFVRRAAVVPLVSRGGTGVQLKSIETFELGLPSVATSSALRGIAYKPDNCVVADDAAAFAAALLRMASMKAGTADGRGFHANQLAVLDRNVALGLDTIGRAGAEAFA